MSFDVQIFQGHVSLHVQIFLYTYILEARSSDTVYLWYTNCIGFILFCMGAVLPLPACRLDLPPGLQHIGSLFLAVTSQLSFITTTSYPLTFTLLGRVIPYLNTKEP
jgi:hypothetical protein